MHSSTFKRETIIQSEEWMGVPIPQRIAVTNNMHRKVLFHSVHSKTCHKLNKFLVIMSFVFINTVKS